VIECPNCGQQVEESAAVCTNCGFDIHSKQADEVRRLREDGQIHPGRIGSDHTEDFRGGDPHEPDIHEELPAEDLGPALEDPRERDAGF
jgi:transcription initiation factor TFIIIB Brf1 subunit/transcription initiation factor TFIIB